MVGLRIDDVSWCGTDFSLGVEHTFMDCLFYEYYGGRGLFFWVQ